MSQDSELSSSSAPLHQLIQGRLEKRERLKAKGINPYPPRCQAPSKIKDVRQRYQGLAQGEESPETVAVAGRILSIRDMGKSSFLHLQDSSAKLQIFLKQDVLGQELYQTFKKDFDIGDILSAKGVLFITKTGELTLRAQEISLLAKSLRPWPEKWHGLKDEELRARQRYLDTTINGEVRELFVKRGLIISALRCALEDRGFLEVETPLLQFQAGGAAAKPFETHHNALDQDLVLRIAHELPLKKLLVGGFDRVYEIGRAFRNEGIDRFHNPEFTLLEAYQAYTDYTGMMELCQDLITNAAKAVGQEQFLSEPFTQVRLPDLWQEFTGTPFSQDPQGLALRPLAEKLGVPLEKKIPEKKIFDKIFDAKILPHIRHKPTFVLDYPLYLSPLAKQKPEDPSLVERFELFIEGQEVANAYSELNDPEEQRARFEEQRKERARGDEEAQLLDEEFVKALEYGMPPAGGIGIGVDRLVMLMVGASSLRDVILFPLLKPV